jgi:hypothetical protein
MALVGHLWRTSSPKGSNSTRLGAARGTRAFSQACRSRSANTAMVRPLTRARKGIEKLAEVLSTRCPSARRADDGRIAAPTDDDARRFQHRELQVVEGVGHFCTLRRQARSRSASSLG